MFNKISLLWLEPYMSGLQVQFCEHQTNAPRKPVQIDIIRFIATYLLNFVYYTNESRQHYTGFLTSTIVVAVCLVFNRQSSCPVDQHHTAHIGRWHHIYQTGKTERDIHLVSLVVEFYITLSFTAMIICCLCEGA